MTNADLARLQIEKHGKDRYPTVEGQMFKLMEEVGELAKEVNRPVILDEKLRGELADVGLALYNLAIKCDIDLDVEIKSKVENDVRKF